MLRTTICVAMLALGGVSAAPAEEFAEGSQAKEWNLLGEEKALFSGKVVDVMCELTGDCAAECGGGNRQLGILRAADDALVLVMKNRQPAFTGGAVDLAPYCGKAVDVDGLLVGDEDQTSVKFYLVQFIRETGTEEWSKTSRWTKEWAKRNPDLKGVKGPWFRKDPRVKAQIEAHGYLGLGAEEDEKFKAYLFE